MRIGIDARFFGGESSKGLGRYTQKLIEYLRQLDQTNEYFIFLTRENFATLDFPEKNFHKVLADFRWYSFQEQWRMPRLLRAYHLDLVHFPHYNVPLFYRGRMIVTIHDLILHHFPTKRASTLNGLFYFLKHFAYKIVIRHALKYSLRILTVSQFTKQDITDSFHIDPSKIVVIYEAAEIGSMTDLSEKGKQEVIQKYRIQEPYILYVGNAYPHKNLEILLEVVHAWQQQRPLFWQLVLVGRMDYFYERLKAQARAMHLGQKEVCFPGFVPDSELHILYEKAEAYIFPSLYEGFGLPPLESMAHGTPVLSASTSSLPEILGDSALYFEPRDKNGIITLISSVLASPQIREELKKKGFLHVRQFHWSHMVRETYAVYLDCLNFSFERQK